MPIELGGKSVDFRYRGKRPSRLYLGDNLVWQAYTPPAPLSPEDAAVIDGIVAASMAANKNKGAMVSISGPAGYYEKAYGSAGNRPLTLDDHFRIGSVTKSFISALVMREVDKETISLSDTVDTYLDGIPGGDQVTIQHMLMMRSGLTDPQSVVAVTFALNPTSPFSDAQALDIIKSKPLKFTPGTQYDYSNANFLLLGYILEEVTGKTYQQLVMDELVIPNGMEHTLWPTGTTLPTPHSKGYGNNPLKSIPILGWFLPAVIEQTAYNPALFGAAGALVSTIGDLQKWGRALCDSKFLSPETTDLWRETFCPVPYNSPGPDNFGYGLGLISIGDWFGHDGSVPGYSTACFYEPNSGAVVCVMENFQTAGLAALTEIWYGIVNHLYPDTLQEPSYACPYLT